MKASSESGLWALTISRGVTEVIAGLANYSVHYCSFPTLPKDGNGKGRPIVRFADPEIPVGDHPIAHHARCPQLRGVRLIRPSGYLGTACPLTTKGRPHRSPVLYVTSRQPGVGRLKRAFLLEIGIPAP